MTGTSVIPSPAGSLGWAPPAELETPALLVDADVVTANAARMSDYMSARGIALRPHAKTHKCREIARIQLAHGAVGLTVASLGEAEVFASETADIFVAYPVFASQAKAARMRALADRTQLSVGIDSIEGAAALADSRLAASVGVLVEIDSGQHRTGVQSESAGPLAARCADLGLDVRGVFTHGGHAYGGPGTAAAAGADERAALQAAASSLRAVGVTPRVVSAGSTPTARWSAKPGVTEERPGTYVFNDCQQIMLSDVTLARVGLTVAATVVSTAVPGQAVVDAGSKSLGTDRPGWLASHGIVPELGNAPVAALSECHGTIRLPPDHRDVKVGKIVRIVPNHACTVVNLFDWYEVFSRGEHVDRWAVAARGRHQ